MGMCGMACTGPGPWPWAPSSVSRTVGRGARTPSMPMALPRGGAAPGQRISPARVAVPVERETPTRCPAPAPPPPRRPR
jgi:hypothetical protein